MSNLGNMQESVSNQGVLTRRGLNESEFESLSLEEILTIFKRWYRLSLITMVGIFIPAVVVIFLILPLYEASGTMWVNRLTPQSQYSVQQGQSSGGTTFRNLERNEEIATYAEMIKARPIAISVVSKLSITMEKLNYIHDARRYVRAAIDGVINGVRYVYNETKFFLGLGIRLSPEAEAELNYVRLIDEVIDRIEVTPVSESNIIRVTFVTSDPILAKEVVNVLLDEILVFSNTIRAERAKSFFTSSTRELRDSLAQAEEELLDLQKKYSVFSSDQQQVVLVTDFAEAKDRLRLMKVELSRLAAVVEAYKKSLQEAEKWILVEEQGVGDIKQGIVWEINPLYQELQLRLVSTEIQLISTRNEAESTEQMLQEYRKDLRLLGDASLLIKVQNRKISQLGEAYQINLRNLDGASAVQAMNRASLSAIRVISYAAYPLKPIRPRRLYYLLIVTLGTLLVGLAMPFMAFLNDSSIADASDVKKYLGLDFVTVFPNMESSSEGRVR